MIIFREKKRTANIIADDENGVTKQNKHFTARVTRQNTSNSNFQLEFSIFLYQFYNLKKKPLIFREKKRTPNIIADDENGVTKKNKHFTARVTFQNS